MSGSLLLTLVLAVLATALAIVAGRRAPRLAFSVALAVLCFVPVWVGVRIGFNGNLFFPVAVFASAAAALALLHTRGMRVNAVDALLAVLVVLTGASLVTGDRSIALAFLVTPFSYFIGGYALGRFGAHRLGADFVYRAVAVVFTIVALFAIVEFLSGSNPFVAVHASNPLYAEWGDVQARGGFNRAEAAFGHPIALGASLALALPLTLAARLPFALRLGMAGVMLTATVLTFSRAAIVCALIGIVVCALTLRTHLTPRQRVAVFAGALAASLAFLPVISTVFSDAGEEASESAGYRANLVPLLSDANLLGLSDSVRRSAAGELTFGGFASIDSQLVLTGLTTGILALCAVLVALALALVKVVMGRAQPATIAVVAQIPALATVALITQYSMVLWLVAGIAATTEARARPAPDVSIRENHTQREKDYVTQY